MKTKEIIGSWTKGYALDQHTTSSIFLGYYPNGTPIFDTKRSEIGELVYECKYQQVKKNVDKLTDICLKFIQDWEIAIDIILPIPSSKQREWHITHEIAESLGFMLMKECNTRLIKKVKETAEIKSISEDNVRRKELEGAFEIPENSLRGKNVLFIDDLYSSGSTMDTVCKIAKDNGAANEVYVLALTYARSRQ